jgi:serine/threonine protein kinase
MFSAVFQEFKEQIATVLQDAIEKYQGRKLKVTRTKEKNINFFAGKESGAAGGKSGAPSTPNHDNKENEDDEDDVDSMMPESKEKVSLKDFELLNLLGKGAFGKVVKVKKKGTDNIFAMKILKKKFIYENQQIEHTMVERAILSAFENPFIMTLRYAFQTKDKLFLVMDFYSGGELYHHLEKKQRFSEEEARKYYSTPGFV